MTFWLDLPTNNTNKNVESSQALGNININFAILSKNFEL